MEKTYKTAFVSPISADNGHVSSLLGDNVKSTMEMSVETDEIAGTGYAQIEWLYFVDTDNEDVEYIGVWWENGELVDYDGVFDLPLQAVELIESAGIKVDRESFGPEVNQPT